MLCSVSEDVAQIVPTALAAIEKTADRIDREILPKSVIEETKQAMQACGTIQDREELARAPMFLIVS
ncbi:hypothetical protein COV06_00275 [Candidatus Uhrbacteria bacterium CG10_big_fil_rev_8_21_14_0_10_50_16]|uniref:Uncharacterized protein n=1 Tax=Candidatus Uhrbacteria bacterium CG10_big_fil_rev_8_21_14_0_10_50_16 TaxID=1975039 RepID=A0A2H0RN03_9BACT|nr:MAG: hypothetical protein COV06_00275 [Candidatus Uhrbacteria bacterium CG10_big_fil_rev_8_21_14_0_10_50_16]